MRMIHSRQIKRISTGSKNLDDLLLGGIESHAITEFYGAAGSGKTQICHTLSVIATHSNENGKVIYVDTEGKFRPERLVTIARARGFNTCSTNFVSNIFYVNAKSAYQQEKILNYSVRRLLGDEHSNVVLLIVDSIINNYRAEFLGPINLSKRQQRLFRLMNLLSYMAQDYGIAVVVTNQVNSSYPYCSTGGKVMTYTSNYRIFLKRRYAGGRVTATIVKSRYHLENKTDLVLGERGIEDM